MHFSAKSTSTNKCIAFFTGERVLIQVLAEVKRKYDRTMVDLLRRYLFFVGSLESCNAMPVAVLHGMKGSVEKVEHEVYFLQKLLPQHEFFALSYASPWATIYHSIIHQSETACELLRTRLGVTEDRLQEREVSLIGHSNGAMVARWVLQNCEGVHVVNFVSVAGPMRGITRE